MTSDLTTKAAEIRAGLVKPLEWMSDRGPFFATSPFCMYRIASVEDDTGAHWETTITYQGSMYKRAETEAEAKAAAQSDYETRILSALNLALIEQQAAELAAVGKVKHYLRMAEVEDPWSAMIDECEAMEARATTAESERDELLREKERLGAGWRDISTAPKDGTLVDLWHGEFGRHADCYWGFPEHCCGEAGSYCDSEWHALEAGWVDGTLNESLDASDFTHWHAHPAPPSALENGPAGLADANSKTPDPSSQSERIAVLEAALRPFAARIDEIEQVKAIAKFATEGTAAVKLTLLRDARSALAPLGEE